MFVGPGVLVIGGVGLCGRGVGELTAGIVRVGVGVPGPSSGVRVGVGVGVLVAVFVAVGVGVAVASVQSSPANGLRPVPRKTTRSMAHMPLGCTAPKRDRKSTRLNSSH